MGVRLPANVDRVGKLSPAGDRPYPPRGFASFEDHALGNGDEFGFYWPVGMEDRTPLVVDMVHDEGVLVPAYSSFDRFLELSADLDEATHPDWPSLEEDEDSPHACYQAARAAVRERDTETAFVLSKRAVDRLPEYTAALCLLWSLSVSAGAHDDACLFAVRAMRSPLCFRSGADVRKVWSWVSRQTNAPDDVATDPIWLNRASLAAPPSGGAKENPVYLALANAADVYASRGAIVEAITLWQTYADFISGETVSFLERYGFTYAAHRERMIALEARLPAGSRAIS